MAMAHAAPRLNREFRFHISIHAVERFRERAEDELRSCTDRDLALILDERVWAAISSDRATDVIDKGQPDENTKIVAIQMRVGQDMHVIMRVARPNGYPPLKTVGGPAGAALAAITVVTNEMAKRNYASGFWFVANRPGAGGLRGSNLGQKIVTALADAPVDSAKKTTTPPLPEPATRGLGGTRQERADFIMATFRENPNASYPYVSKKVEEKFGTGIAKSLYERVRGEYLVGVNVTKTPVQAAAKETKPSPISRDFGKGVPSDYAPAPAASNAATIAAQFMEAVEAEKVAKARVVAAERELAAAKQIEAGTTAQVTALLEQLQAQRG